MYSHAKLRLFLVVALLAGSGAEAGQLELASRAQGGAPQETPNGDSGIPVPPGPSLSGSAVSADGRYVVFLSEATNLDVPGLDDVNGSAFDVFLYDRTDKTLTLVSHAAGSPAVTGNNASATFSRPVISADGRYVAFASSATDLVAGQTDLNATWDLFLYDRVSGSTSLVSRTPGSPTTTGDDSSYEPSISDDGRYVAFTSWAGDLVAGQSAASPVNVFVYDRVAGTTQLASGTGGSPSATGNYASYAPSISSDGSAVAFLSSATNLVPGQVDNNGAADVFLYDRASASLRLVSHKAGSPLTTGSAESGMPSLSADGDQIAYLSLALDLVPNQVGGGAQSWDVFHYQAPSDTTTLVTHAYYAPNAATGEARLPVLSPDGRFVVFESEAFELIQNLFPVAENLYLWDRESNTPSWIERFQFASPPVFSADAGYIAFAVYNDNFAPVTERNSSPDVFLYNRAAQKVQLLSRITTTAYPTTANNNSFGPSLSADGSTVAFQSYASDLLSGDGNQSLDVFVYSRQAGAPTGDFFTLPPCRLLDTRPGPGYEVLHLGSTHNLQVHGVCGIPATAKAIVANVTVTQTTEAGHLILFPGDQPPPVASTINFGAEQTRANNAILPLATDGNGVLTARPFFGATNGYVHLILDVSGYFE